VHRKRRMTSRRCSPPPPASLRCRLPITTSVSPQHGHGTTSAHRTKNAGDLLNQLVLCYNDHVEWGMLPVRLFPQTNAQGRHPFPFLRYGHYIRQLLDRQSRQQLDVSFKQQHHNFIKIDNVYFSVLNEKVRQRYKLQIERSVFCKDFMKDEFLPLQETKSFSNIDIMLGFWSRLQNVRENTMIYFQMIDPSDELYIMHFEILKHNENDGYRDYYFGMQIQPLLKEGIWTARLIQNNKIICEERASYKVLRNNYYNPTQSYNGSIFINKNG